MYNATRGHRILEKLDEAFPRKLHLHELRAALPEYGSLPPHEWLLAVEALKVEGKLDGKFLQDGTSIADAAALFITTFGRLYLRGPEGLVANNSFASASFTAWPRRISASPSFLIARVRASFVLPCSFSRSTRAPSLSTIRIVNSGSAAT